MIRNALRAAICTTAAFAILATANPAFAGWGWEDLDPTNSDSDIWGDDGVVDQTTPDFIPTPPDLIDGTQADFEICNYTADTIMYYVDETDSTLYPNYCETWTAYGTADVGFYDISYGWTTYTVGDGYYGFDYDPVGRIDMFSY